MLNSLLSSSTQKQVVGVSLTPGIGLEVVLYDKNKNTVLKYGRKKVDYNFSTREISDTNEFKSALSSLVQELGIGPKTASFLVLPNVYFDFIEIPSQLSNEETKNAILSRAEDFYLFKKVEPVSGWCPVANLNDPTQKKLAYTSFQKNTVDNFKDIFNDIGLQLIGIESAYSATIRGLFSIGALDDIIHERESWTAMIINTNSFTLMHFDADNLLDCSEVPVAIKSFSTEEAYAAIASSISQRLDNFSCSKLYVISQTDDICAATLKNQLEFEKEIYTIDSNKFSDKPIAEVSQIAGDFRADAMTLASIGASCIKTDFPLIINVLAEDLNASLGVYATVPIMGMMVDITSELILKLAIIIALVIVVVFGSIFVILSIINNNISEKISSMSSEITDIQQNITAMSQTEEKQEIDMSQIINQVAQINVKAIKFFDSIASDIPKNIWLTRYYNLNGDKVIIRGVAENITDVYEYFKNLKIVSPESDIKLTELKVFTGKASEADLIKGLDINSEKTRLYIFEISTSDTSLNVKPQAPEKRPDEASIIIKALPAPDEAAGGVEQLSDQVKPTD